MLPRAVRRRARRCAHASRTLAGRADARARPRRRAARRLRHAADQRRQDRFERAAARSRRARWSRSRSARSPSPEQTGVRLLPLGAYSLDTRIQLAQRATSSLDVQYYVLENDPTGRLLMKALRDASVRGVRVRLLVDDLYTTHSDPLLRGLASFPNFEVRLFNPFCCNRSRRRRRPLHGVDLRLRPAQPPHAQQALHRRRRDGGRRRTQHRRRVFPARDGRQLRRHGRVRHGRRGQVDVGHLRPLLEQRGRVPDRGGRRAARRQAGARQGVRRADRQPAALAADRSARDRPARLRPARRGARLPARSASSGASPAPFPTRPKSCWRCRRRSRSR